MSMKRSGPPSFPPEFRGRLLKSLEERGWLLREIGPELNEICFERPLFPGHSMELQLLPQRAARGHFGYVAAFIVVSSRQAEVQRQLALDAPDFEFDASFGATPESPMPIVTIHFTGLAQTPEQPVRRHWTELRFEEASERLDEFVRLIDRAWPTWQSQCGGPLQLIELLLASDRFEQPNRNVLSSDAHLFACVLASDAGRAALAVELLRQYDQHLDLLERAEELSREQLDELRTVGSAYKAWVHRN